MKIRVDQLASSSKPRNTHVRSKITALLVSLVALWAFAAYVTAQAGLNLLWISTLDQGVGRPTDALVTALQAERRASMVYVGGGRGDPRVTLDEARAATDRARTTMETSATSTGVTWAATDEFESRVANLLASLGTLTQARESVDSGSFARRSDIAGAYTKMIDSAFLVYDQLGQFANEISGEGRTVVALSRSRELLAQEDAMLAGVLAAGSFSPGEPAEFVQVVGAQRAFYAEQIARLSDEDRAGYDRVVRGAEYQRFAALESSVIEQGRADAPLPLSGKAWSDAVEPVLGQLRQFELDLADRVLERAKPEAIGILVRLALAGGLGLIAVIASIVVSITTARKLVRQLERLRNAAEELASYRLPRVVERLQHGEKVDVEAEAPPLDFGRDEIGQVGQAFNGVQETAIRVAVEQAELRRSVRDVFLSLARRSQALLHRQLGLLDAMERRATDAEELAELFRVDHLATRMRRNAENLIVLSGATAGRAWRKPVPMVDVVRGALAEVEDYTRVTVLPTGSASLIGRAVGDVIHLLAELIENAVSFSPPQTVVRVGGSIVGNGFALEIEDRGLGMSEEEMEAANEQLRNPPEFKLSSTARLGLYVVGKLAERHGIRVRLTGSPYGGTTAIVLLPATLMADEGPADESPVDGDVLDDSRTSQLAAIAAGPRHAAEARPVATVHSSPSEGTPFVASPQGAPPLPSRASTRSPARATPPVDPDAPILTPSGLPWRQRRVTGDRPPVLEATAVPLPGFVNGSPPGGDGSSARQPEQIRSQLSSYRSGTLRGRDDAARLDEPDPDTPEWTARQESPGTDEGA